MTREHDEHPDHMEHGRRPPLPPGVGIAFEDGPGEYLYKWGEVLVAVDDADAAERALRHHQAKQVDRDDRLGLATFRLAKKDAVPEAVSELRKARDGHPILAGPNLVFSFSSHVMWAPGAVPPRPAEPRSEITSTAGAGVRVGVVDTGAAVHHGWFGGRVCGDDDPADDGNGVLDPAAGHGTFVAGVVLQHAPAATVEVRRAKSVGYLTDELAVARAILDLADVHVLNLSLGTYGHGDAPPVALLSALQQVWEKNPGIVIVAGAGNDDGDRPFWPAALKRVVAVAAVDRAHERASFSNFGWWVDACAPGVDAHSTFLKWDGPTSEGTDESFQEWATWSGTSFAAPYVAGVIASRVAEAGTAAEAAARVIRAGSAPHRRGLGTLVADPPVA